MGSPAQRLEDACAPDHFDINKLQFVTLLGEFYSFFLPFIIRSSAILINKTLYYRLSCSVQSRVGSVSHRWPVRTARCHWSAVYSVPAQAEPQSTDSSAQQQSFRVGSRTGSHCSCHASTATTPSPQSSEFPECKFFGTIGAALVEGANAWCGGPQSQRHGGTRAAGIVPEAGGESKERHTDSAGRQWLCGEL